MKNLDRVLTTTSVSKANRIHKRLALGTPYTNLLTIYLDDNKQVDCMFLAQVKPLKSLILIIILPNILLLTKFHIF